MKFYFAHAVWKIALGLIFLAKKLRADLILPWSAKVRFSAFEENSLRREYYYRILSTRPYIVGEDNPNFEIHMLLGHNHVGMALGAIKSFLHFSNKKYKVVLHDDGSLTNRDIDILGKHLINVRIIEKSLGDELIRPQLTNLTYCYEYRFSEKITSDHRGRRYNMRIFSMRLFDFNLLTHADKVLVLDADVLFFKHPTEIVQWSNDSTDTRALYSVEQFKPSKDERDNIICFERKTPTFNAGLLCIEKSSFKLDVLERWISSNIELMYKVPTFEQKAYEYLVATQGVGIALPDTYSFNYTDEEVSATHFAIKKFFFINFRRIQKDLTSV